MITFFWFAVLVLSAIIAYKSKSYAGAFILLALPAYLLRTQIGPLPTTVLEAVVLGSLLGFFIATLKNGKHNITKFLDTYKRPLCVTAFILTLVALIEAFVSPDIRAGLGVWRAYFLEPALVLPLFVMTWKDVKSRTILLYGLGLEVIAISIFAILQALGLIPIIAPWTLERRATSIFPFPNAVGLFLGPLISFFIGLAIFDVKTDTKVRFFFKAVAIIGFIGILSSKTVGAIGAVLVVFFLLAIIKGGWMRKITIAVAIFAVLVCVLVSPIRDALTKKFTFNEWSGTVRRVMWQETVTMLETRPIFGAGLSGYQTAVAPFHPAKDVEIFQYPHNEFLNVWSELGILGLLMWAWITWKFTKSTDLRKTDKNQAFRIAAAAAILTMFIHGLVDVPYFKNDLALLTWFFLIIPLATTL